MLADMFAPPQACLPGAGTVTLLRTVQLWGMSLVSDCCDMPVSHLYLIPGGWWLLMFHTVCRNLAWFSCTDICSTVLRLQRQQYNLANLPHQVRNFEFACYMVNSRLHVLGM